MRLETPAARLVALGLAGSLAALSCTPQSPSDPELTVGSIQVDVSTSGSGVPASFSVALDGGSPRTISPNGSTNFSSLAPGGYAVALSVPSNCAVSGSSSRSVTVREGVTSNVAFSVDCSAIPTGAIGVTTVTTGDPLDPDGYSLTVDGSPGPSIGTNATTLIPDLTVTEHEIGLTDAADNCAVQDANPRSVNVSENQTTQIEFQIVCSATTGLIDVSVTTTGPEPDADGYTVNLDGTSSQTVTSNGSVTFTGVQESGHTLTLEDIAPNCSVDGDNPVSADVVAGETTDVSFSVICEATVGSLQVSASTSGDEQDPNGYSVSVDGGPEQALGVNGSTTFTDLPAGPHDVELTGVAANCSVAGDNPRSVDVTAGQTASTTFDVSCSSTVGSIEVTVTTTGDAIDADGYTVVLDGGADTQLVDPNDVITFGGLAPGEHTLALQNVADNCTVTSDNPVTADVTAGQTTPASFTVTCEQLTGDIQVNTTTTGSDPDPDGYQVAVDGGTPLSIGINGSRTFQDEVIGEHEVELSGVATNCAVQGDNPRTITVNQDQITQVNFSVDCSSTTGQIEVTVTTTGDDLDPDGYTIDLDGTSSRSVATNGSTTFTGVAPGSHTLTLQNAASNCTVTSSNPVNTNVTAGSTSSVSFDVECTRLTGDIRVFTSSSGSPSDANGYQVSVDGGAARAIGINDQELFADLQPGGHTVTLSDIAPQCTVSGSTTRNVTVNADQETQVTFTVTCDPLEGDIQVNVSTTGEDPDNSYVVRLDGDPGTDQSVSGNDTAFFLNIPTGNHSVALLNVASNCDEGTNPKSTTVIDDQTVQVDFDVSCVGLTGDLEVTTSTTGSDLDPDGYTVTVDGGMATSFAINDTQTFQDLDDGDHQVELTGLAANCTVSGNNPRTVSVPANGTASTTFDVTCTETEGSIAVDVTTSGDDQDTDGYTITLDGGTPRSVGPNGSTTYLDLTPGDYDVGIDVSTVASNCTVNETNPQTASVTAGSTTNVSFTVSCTQLTGDLRVITSTSGSDLDPDGYTVTVDGGMATSIGVNDTITFQDVPDGNRSVELTGEAANCSISNPNPRNVNVPANGTGSTTFSVECTPTTGAIEVTATTTTGTPDADGYLVSVDAGADQFIDDATTVLFEGLAEGSHDVEMSGLGACSVSSPSNPATPTVVAGDTVNVDFSVQCP